MSLTFNLVNNQIYAIVQPPTPTITSVVQSPPNNIIVSWDNLSNLLTYNLICSDNTLNVYGIKTNSYSVTVTPGVSYIFKVVSVINTSIIPVSSVPSVALNPITYLSVPSVTATSSILGVSDSTGSITITWNEITGATKYNIIPSLSSISSIPGIVLNGITDSTIGIMYNSGSYSYTISNIPSGSTSSFQIVDIANDGSQNISDNSNSVTLLNQPSTPIATLSGSSILISWNGVAGATSYNLISNTSFSLLGITSSTSNVSFNSGSNNYTYNYSSGLVGVSYTFQIAAVYSNINPINYSISNYSNSSQNIQIPIPIPNTPDLVWLKFDNTTYNPVNYNKTYNSSTYIPLNNSSTISGTTFNFYPYNGNILNFTKNSKTVSLLINKSENNGVTTGNIFSLIYSNGIPIPTGATIGIGYTLCYWIYIPKDGLPGNQPFMCAFTTSNTLYSTSILTANTFIGSTLLGNTSVYGSQTNFFNTYKVNKMSNWYYGSTVNNNIVSNGSYDNNSFIYPNLYNSWYHIAMVHICTGTNSSNVYNYVNGIKINNTAIQTTYPTTSINGILNIAGSGYNNVQTLSSFTFYSNIRLYGKPLSDTDISNMYNYDLINTINIFSSNVPIPDIIWLKFDGSNLLTNSASGNSVGINVNSTNGNITNITNNSVTVALIKNILNGNNNYVITSDNFTITGGTTSGIGYSLCFWVYLPSYYTININLINLSNISNYFLGYTSNNNSNGSSIGFNFVYYSNSVSDTTITWPYNNWYHFCMVQTCTGSNTSAIFSYINASLIEYSTTVDIYPATNQTVKLNIAGTNQTSFYSDIRVYSRPLDPSEVNSIYNYGLSKNINNFINIEPDILYLNFNSNTFSLPTTNYNFSTYKTLLNTSTNNNIIPKIWFENGRIQNYNNGNLNVAFIQSINNNYTITTNLLSIPGGQVSGLGYSLCYWINIPTDGLPNNNCALFALGNFNSGGDTVTQNINSVSTYYLGNIINGYGNNVTSLSSYYYINSTSGKGDFNTIINYSNNTNFNNSNIYNTWYHICIVQKTNGLSVANSINQQYPRSNVLIYINGILNIDVYSNDFPGSKTISNNVNVITGIQANLGIAGNNISAYYSDLRIYGRPISNTEIINIYNSGITSGISSFSVPSTIPIFGLAYYDFSTYNGLSLFNSATNLYDAILSDTNIKSINKRNGYNIVNFNGSNYITLNSCLFSNLQSGFSISFWMKFNSGISSNFYYTIASFAVGSGGTAAGSNSIANSLKFLNISAKIYSTNYIYVLFYLTDSTGNMIINDYVLFTTNNFYNDWNNIIITVSSTIGSNYPKLILYYNGVASFYKGGTNMTNRTLTTLKLLLPLTSNNYLGFDGGSNYFIGSISNFNIYNYELTTSQVQTLVSM
uniref:Uncharacterized protein n=1 Tax=viral metagenome TaxID=1070528 RepID=A0A6C0HU42_9ZZZZ